MSGQQDDINAKACIPEEETAIIVTRMAKVQLNAESSNAIPPFVDFVAPENTTTAVAAKKHDSEAEDFVMVNNDGGDDSVAVPTPTQSQVAKVDPPQQLQPQQPQQQLQQQQQQIAASPGPLTLFTPARLQIGPEKYHFVYHKIVGGSLYSEILYKCERGSEWAPDCHVLFLYHDKWPSP